MNPKTILEKIWNAHTVVAEPDAPTVLYIDLHLIHELTSPQAFAGLREKGNTVRRPDRTYATMDHGIPTTGLELPLKDKIVAKQLAALRQNCQDFDIRLFDAQDRQHGIVHVLGPEQGLTQPGKTIVCGDSHTSTHGAFGALAFGIGTTEVEHVLTTQCLLVHRPKTFLVQFDGKLQTGVTAKDMILALIAKNGVAGGTGHVFEYAGTAIQSLSMEARMTICNMSIEGGARAGIIAPDDTTIQYIAGRNYAPKREAWERAITHWRTLPTDRGAIYDQQLTINVSNLQPMITYGTNPSMGIPITAPIPDPARESDFAKRTALNKALQYMDLQPNKPLLGHKIDVVFVGSCTNSRLSNLRQASTMLAGRKVADHVRMLVVPGSENVRRQAEAEGLHDIFLQAGAEWRNAGCSMCVAMNGDQLQPGQYAVSTSNRNFEGRQGAGGRTFLASPLTAVASAITGHVTDPRTV